MAKTQPAVATEAGTAKRLYESLVPDRQPFLTRAIEASQYTIPTLVPPLGHTKATKFYTPYQSVGARGVRRIKAGDDRLFPTLTYVALRRQWEDLRAIMKKEDDPNFIVHVLRHTCATRLVSKGVPINVVQAWMGHAVIATTLRYAHVLPNALMAAVGVLEPEQTVPA